MSVEPRMLLADTAGNIMDDPYLLMVGDRGGQWFLPGKADLLPLPAESELFFLPGRHAAGFNPGSGRIEIREELAVAAFAAPGYTISAHPAYGQDRDAPLLPLFAYGAAGFADGRFWVCARKVDSDPRQQFGGISGKLIDKNCRQLLVDYPGNRLVHHIINNCVRRYACPAARNFALGRYEAPLPTSRVCNARCVGCISARSKDSPVRATPQCRLDFVPSSSEIVQVMKIHESRERNTPIYSFGQGCEGDPLINAELLAASIQEFRALRNSGKGGTGTINCNTNASRPRAVAMLAESGLTSLRVSLNSARPQFYETYYRPVDYHFADVCQSMREARSRGVFVSLNLLYFPGVTDTEDELQALAALCAENGVSMIQWRNLNIDPRWYLDILRGKGLAESAETETFQPAIGLRLFMKKLKRLCPWLVFGYFNPYLGDMAKIEAPMPGA